eukprot:SAG22_NODE_17085_length_311_cov_1.716981_1_plen_79_part_10
MAPRPGGQIHLNGTADGQCGRLAPSDAADRDPLARRRDPAGLPASRTAGPIPAALAAPSRRARKGLQKSALGTTKDRSR